MVARLEDDRSDRVKLEDVKTRVKLEDVKTRVERGNVLLELGNKFTSEGKKKWAIKQYGQIIKDADDCDIASSQSIRILELQAQFATVVMQARLQSFIICANMVQTKSQSSTSRIPIRRNLVDMSSGIIESWRRWKKLRSIDSMTLFKEMVEQDEVMLKLAHHHIVYLQVNRCGPLCDTQAFVEVGHQVSVLKHLGESKSSEPSSAQEKDKGDENALRFILNHELVASLKMEAFYSTVDIATKMLKEGIPMSRWFLYRTDRKLHDSSEGFRLLTHAADSVVGGSRMERLAATSDLNERFSDRFSWLIEDDSNITDPVSFHWLMKEIFVNQEPNEYWSPKVMFVQMQNSKTAVRILEQLDEPVSDEIALISVKPDDLKMLKDRLFETRCVFAQQTAMPKVLMNMVAQYFPWYNNILPTPEQAKLIADSSRVKSK